MRVLVIAPDQPGINTRPEIRQIQRRHHMSVLDGTVTATDIYECCRETHFDVHHYATHSGPDGVELSNQVIFGPEEIAQVARLKETQTLFFNSCQAGKLASYAVRHGLRYAVHTNIDLEDAEAWKAAIAFYGSMENGHAKDIVGAYVVADSGDGEYGLAVSPTYIQELQARAAAAILPTAGMVTINRWQMVLFGIGVLLASGAWTMLINVLSGR
jgi:hypothetical protein